MKDVQLIHPSGEFVRFGQEGFVLDGYDIKAIGAVHRTYEGYSQNGEYRISSRFSRREILLSFHIYADNRLTMEEKKRRITRVADPIGEFELCLGDKRIRCCGAETAEFSEREPYRKGLVASGALRLLCLAPCFYAASPRRAVYGDYEGMLAFPVALTEAGDVMGYMPAGHTLRLQNDGDLSVGMTVTVTALGDCSHFLMETVDGTARFLYDHPLAAGQTLTFCTEYGKKSAVVTADGAASPALQYVAPDSAFFQLSLGENIYTWDSGGGACRIVLEANEQYLI